MFHEIPQPVLRRMAYLESVDARDRRDSTPQLERLRQIPAESGRFLALLAASAPPGQILEVGTSAGYSSLWLILACRGRGDRLVTYEILDGKVRLAQETFSASEVQEDVQLIQGDARQHLDTYRQVAFCFLDAEKYVYQECYELVVPNLVKGGFLVADNVISHAQELQDFVRHAQEDPRLDALILPIGSGLLLCRKA